MLTRLKESLIFTLQYLLFCAAVLVPFGALCWFLFVVTDVLGIHFLYVEAVALFVIIFLCHLFSKQLYVVLSKLGSLLNSKEKGEDDDVKTP